jgi:hypothetical protein
MEQFKVITGFCDYMVSNMGYVKNIKTGRVVPTGIDSNGYFMVSLSLNNRELIRMIHRLVADAFLENQDGKKCVDHIDNNRLNNSIFNLRFATHKENSQNKQIGKNNTSGYKGVSFTKSKNKWRAYIGIDGKLKHLGYFDTIEEAIKVRQLKANEIQGLFVNNCEKL